VQFVVGGGVGVFHGHPRSELDVFVDCAAELRVGRHVSLVDGCHVELDETLTLRLGDLEAAVDGDEMPEAELAREAVPVLRMTRL
jgi:hypothetical protein